MAHIEITDEGDTKQYSAEEYADAGGRIASACTMAVKQGRLEDGSLTDEVQHNEHVAQRGIDEGAFVAKISVPYWFKKDDEEIEETFGDKDEITALVEDYSEKAWRIIGKQQTAMGDDYWFTWAWTFVPKSVSNVVRVVGVEDYDSGFEFSNELTEINIARRKDRSSDDDEDDANDNADEDDEKDGADDADDENRLRSRHGREARRGKPSERRRRMENGGDKESAEVGQVAGR